MNVAVVGATGAVGKQLLEILESREFPVTELVPFASPRSEGKKIPFKGKDWTVRALSKGGFAGVKIAFFDASDAISKEWVPEAVSAGAFVIDNSATYRMDSGVPLIVPEINGHLMKAPGKQRIFAGPNCSTVQLVLPLKVLRDHFGLKRVIVSTYQSVSGAGAAAMDELTEHVQAAFAGKRAKLRNFLHPIAFNCIPQIGGFKDDGFTSEEQKIMAESKKILDLPNLRISATAVRVPTYSCHGESVTAECEKPVTPEAFRELLANQAGIEVQDDPSKSFYPMGSSSAGRDSAYVGRIRRDPSSDNGVTFWVVSDNLRKGAALNAIQMGEILVPQFA